MRASLSSLPFASLRSAWVGEEETLVSSTTDRQIMIFNFEKFIKSIRVALQGLKSAASEQTFQIFCFIAALVIILMFLFEVSLYEKLILVLIITFVMALELINSQIERVLDIFQLNYDPRIKIIKDISAGAVLLASLGAGIIGILIFWPHFQKLLF